MTRNGTIWCICPNLCCPSVRSHWSASGSSRLKSILRTTRFKSFLSRMTSTCRTFWNGRTRTQFQQDFRPVSFPITVHIISDGTTENEPESGPWPAMKLGMDFGSRIRMASVPSSLLVIRCSGRISICLDSLAATWRVIQLLSLPDVPAKTEELHLRGIIEIQPDGKVVRMLEKPSPEDTESRWQCPCFYLFNRSVLEKLNRFLEQDSSFKDATGLFLSFLVNEAKVCSYPISGRYDIWKLKLLPWMLEWFPPFKIKTYGKFSALFFSNVKNQASTWACYTIWESSGDYGCSFHIYCDLCRI